MKRTKKTETEKMRASLSLVTAPSWLVNNMLTVVAEYENGAAEVTDISRGATFARMRAAYTKFAMVVATEGDCFNSWRDLAEWFESAQDSNELPLDAVELEIVTDLILTF